jgi:hypothetical protein
MTIESDEFGNIIGLKRHMVLRRIVRRTLSSHSRVMKNFIFGLYGRVPFYMEPRVIYAVLKEVTMKNLLKIY